MVDVYVPQTAKATAGRIAAGTSGHVAIGDFLDDFYALTSQDDRQSLIAEAPGVEVGDYWGAYLAATVETLTGRYDLDVPPWTQDERYVLPIPWFGLRKARMYLLLKTPCPFARRRLFVGDRVLDRV